MYHQKYHKFNKLYNHKYGFHINGPNQAAYETAIRLQPRVIKTLEHDVGAMSRIREAVPDAFLIGRLFDPVQDFGNEPGSDPMSERLRRAKRRGISFAEKILRLEVNQVHVNGRPVFNAWESFNEIFPESVGTDTQKVYDEFQVAFGQVMLAAGFEPVAMNFATGNFRGRHFIENFPGTLETYKYLGFHEYDWPRLDRLHQQGLAAADVEQNRRDRVPGISLNRGNDGMWLCLRYRRIMHEGVRQKYGDRHVCIITECGMTQGVQQGDDVGPWFHTNTLPRHKPDSALPGQVDEEQYWQQLLWYNGELMKDDYVMGACLFVTGAVGKWWSFEHLGPLMERLAAFQREAGPADVEITPTSTISPVISSVTTAAGSDAMPAVLDSEITPDMNTGGIAAPDLVDTRRVEQWSLFMTTGQGLALLACDIGLANEPVTIIRPNGVPERLTSGTKPEYGLGGFETYAPDPGLYQVQFLDQSFEIRLEGRFTKVVFARTIGGDDLQVDLNFRQVQSIYAVGEEALIGIEVMNPGRQPVPFTVLGLLAGPDRFQSCQENGFFAPGEFFRQEAKLSFDTPGIYKVQLAICSAPREACQASWVPFEPRLQLVVR